MIVSVGEVAPDIFTQLQRLLVPFLHWYDIAVPTAVILKLADVPLHTVVFAGCELILGAAVMVKLKLWPVLLQPLAVFTVNVPE